MFLDGVKDSPGAIHSSGGQSLSGERWVIMVYLARKAAFSRLLHCRRMEKQCG